MKVVIAAGSRFHSFRLAEELAKRDVLYKFFTGTSLIHDDFQKPFRQHVVVCHIHAFLDKIFFKFRFYKIISLSTWYLYKNDLFAQWLARQIKKLDNFDVFVCWAGYARHAIPIARAKGAKIIIESGSFHIAEQAQLLHEEYKLCGIFQEPIKKNMIDAMSWEYEHADFIMTPATHVAESFKRQGISPRKILRVAYGNEINTVPVSSAPTKKSQFTVLFVGMIGIQKGIHYLLEAWRLLQFPIDTTQLVLVGNIESSFHRILDTRHLPANVLFKSGMSHEKVHEEYRAADVFVLPSIHDGFGMVIGEAMSHGVPIIATENTGAREWIEDAKEGFITPVRRADVLAEKIQWFYDHPQKRKKMGILAQETIQNWTWDLYGGTVVSQYKQHVIDG